MTRWLLTAAAAALGCGTTVIAAQTPNSAPTLPIVVYHEIRVSGETPPDGPTAISLARFEAEMRDLKAQGYTTLSMDEVVRFLKGEPFPDKVVAVHLDDGWKSGLAAVPILNELGFKATFWIIAGTGIGWPHLDWTEIGTIAANPRFDLYSHTLTHPWKTRDTLPDWLEGRTPGKGVEDARRELTESRRLLEQKLGRSVPYLAWPSGLYNQGLVALALEAGYTALLTIDDGVNRPGQDLLHIHRTMIDGRCSQQMFRQILLDGTFRSCENDPGAPVTLR